MFRNILLGTVKAPEVVSYALVLKYNPAQRRAPSGSSQGGQWVKGGGSAGFYGTKEPIPISKLLSLRARAQLAGTGSPEDKVYQQAMKERAHAQGDSGKARIEAEAESIARRGGGKAGYATMMNAPTGEGFVNRPRGVGLPEPPPEASKNSQIAEKLASGDVSSSEANEGGVNASVVVELDNGLKALYKPERGEAWDGAFANGDINDYITNKDFSLAEREAFAYEVDDALNLGIVPATVLRTKVDESNIEFGSSDEDGGGYDEDYAKSRYESYKEKAQEDAMEAVGQEMYEKFGEAQQEYADDAQSRADDMADIWNELVDEHPEAAAALDAAGDVREHPTLPMGSQPAFERRAPGPVDPWEVLEEAGITDAYDMGKSLDSYGSAHYEAVKDILRRKMLEEGATELGDLDEDEVKEKLEYDDWIQEHSDTENQLYESKIQSFDSWRHSHGFDSGDGGGGYSESKLNQNSDAPHPRGGSFQHYRDDVDSWGDVTQDGGAKLAVLDYVIGTMDRHGGNLLFDGNGPVAIDNGYSMPGVGGDSPDSFTFRSHGVGDWKSNYGSKISDTLRMEILSSMSRTNWQAMVERHPSMSDDEREAFLGRVERMKKALRTPDGLASLWSKVHRMY